jgi:hypothetical protein
MDSNETMVPISGRLPDDLYEWLATFPLAGATTVSDKVRVAVAELKRRHEGDSNYLEALNMYRDLGRNTRDQIATLELAEHAHSDVLAALMEHVPALMATLNAAQVSTLDSAKHMEAQLVRRTLQLAETLLRQGVTTQAAAFDVDVINRHSGALCELARMITKKPTPL